MAEELVRISEDFYILSTSARLDDRTRVLKHGDTFAVFDRFGDIDGFGPAELGIYHEDTRYLSRLVLRLEGRRPLLLNSSIRHDNASLAVDLMNPDLVGRCDTFVPRGTVHMFRSRILWDATCYERLRIHNYGPQAVELMISIEIDSDFADIFEVRGQAREHRGRMLAPSLDGTSIVLGYEGLDRHVRRTRLRFDAPPDSVVDRVASYVVQLGSHDERTYCWSISCEPERAPTNGRHALTTRLCAPPTLHYEDAAREALSAFDETGAGGTTLATSSKEFDAWWHRSFVDLAMMRTETVHGPYPYAGVPWFSTAFGRDGILTAFECLWLEPDIARGVLSFLCATQADATHEEQDSEPGKVLHETRAGEMANLGEVPFGRYYGSVDATPLFVMLAGAWYERTGDLAFARTLWPHVERALAWIDDSGDVDGDGFVEYARTSPRGLVHQGWKDSHDSVFHSDGRAAEPPIALCEVQGYVYAAKIAAATLAGALDLGARRDDLTRQAALLKRRFEEAFWCEELATYSLALDGAKSRCDVRTSNAGHCLFSGIADPMHAAHVARTLVDDERSWSGWGVRTVATSEAGYNPMSYHNGSVWPHDNAVIAAGLARYGHKREVAKILGGMFEASRFFDLHRLPELFCGFPRRQDEGPTLYPVSCAPQAWAAGAVSMLLQSSLGLAIDGTQRSITFSQPVLPRFLDEVRIHGLRVADAVVDLRLSRHGEHVGIDVTRRDGFVSITTVE